MVTTRFHSHLICVILVSALWISGCTTQAPPPASSSEPTRSEGTYILLSERPPAFLQIDPSQGTLLAEAALPIPDYENQGPEGIAFLPNAEAQRMGLDAASGAGYLLVTVQVHAQLYIFDWHPTNGVQLVKQLALPGIKDDIAALQYRDGTLWAMATSERKLHQFDLQQLLAGDPATQPVYNLKPLAFKTKDIEGLFMQPDGTGLLANDSANQLIFVAEFPACATTQTCQPTDTLKKIDQPSDVGWDASSAQYVYVSRNNGTSRVYTLDPTTKDSSLLYESDYDLEGIVVLP